MTIDTNIWSLKERRHDAAIFVVRHSEYLSLNSGDILLLLKGVRVVIDANNILDDAKAKDLLRAGVKIVGIGKGHWNAWGTANA